MDRLMPAALVTLPAVPIAQVGVWATSTGVWNCTAEQLAAAVAAQSDPAFRTPILKIGHTDPRFTDGQILGDGEPAIGRMENLRLTDAGQTLVADFVGVPAWLAEIMASAYPSRSVEAMEDVTSPSGTTYALVVTGCALLGVQPPAIESLGDIADLYGQNRDLTAWVAARLLTASALNQESPMPQKIRRLGTVVASATIDELIASFEAWAETQPLLGGDSWVRDVNTDSLVATVWRGDDCTYWRVAWTETDGTCTFGPPEQVRPTYEPVPAATATAASAMPDTPTPNGGVLTSQWSAIHVRSPRGRGTAASTATREELRVPIPTALAERLGVSADADDDAVLSALDAKLATTQSAGPGDEDTDDKSETEETGDVEALVAAAVERATKPLLASIASNTTELAVLKAEKVAKAREALIGGAIAAGKIRPADRTKFEAQYDKAPEVVEALLGTIAAGSAVPVTASGYTGGGDGTVDGLSPEDAALLDALGIGEKARA
jgi:hypothetical protein